MKIPSSTLKARVENVAQRLRAEGLGALVVYSTGTALGFTSHTHGYVRYLADWDGHNSGSVLIVIPDREPTLLISLPYLYQLAKETIWFNDVRFVPSNHLGREIVEILKPVVSSKRKVGLIGRTEMPAPLYDALTKGLRGAQWADVNRIIDELRTVKDDIQIAYHRKAAEICDSMFKTLAGEIKKGKSAYRLQADMEHTARCAGCEYAATWLTVGPVADRPRFYKEECSGVPQPGDQVIAGLMIIFEGHWGHAVRTGTFSEPTDAQKEVFSVALEMEEAALRHLKPGLNLNDVQKASDAVLNTYYPRGEGLNQFRFRCGHSLGLDYEDPLLTEAFPQPGPCGPGNPSGREGEMPPVEIKPGMVFELHPNLFVTNVAGAVIGDMVLVTETGNEILNRFPRDLILWRESLTEPSNG
jgi:Xaa-Pro dipeptidase